MSNQADMYPQASKDNSTIARFVNVAIVDRHQSPLGAAHRIPASGASCRFHYRRARRRVC